MEWLRSDQPVGYGQALSLMEERARAVRDGSATGLVWLLEHPPLYTAGTSSRAEDLLDAERFPVYATGRGGKHTYHGPGQRVAYVVLDLKRLFAPASPDLRQYVKRLEHWIIAVLADFGIESFVRDGRIGVWTQDPKLGEAKIAALGVRVQKWVSTHGIAINVQPELRHFSGIVPCGIGEYGVTSLQALGIHATMEEVDASLKKHFSETVLGPT